MKIRHVAPLLALAACASPEVSNYLSQPEAALGHVSVSAEYIMPSLDEIPLELTGTTISDANVPYVEQQEIDKIIKEQEATNRYDTVIENQQIQEAKHDILIPREELFAGNKIADITLTNPNGDVLVNMPLIVVTDIYNESFSDAQLKRGAVIFVAHPDVNPDKFGDELGIPQMGLPGEDGVINIFGHNVTQIEPDFDGDPFNSVNGPLQYVFYRLDEVQHGAEIQLKLIDAAGGEIITYRLVSTRIVDNVQPNGKGTGMTFEKAYELYSSSSELSSGKGLQLIKCEPAEGNAVRDRFVATFEQTQ